jgi:hypothetical protein
MAVFRRVKANDDPNESPFHPDIVGGSDGLRILMLEFLFCFYQSTDRLIHQT